MAQQTAVDWLANELKSKGHALITSEGIFINVPNELIDKAKAMEEEQIIDAWNDGICIKDTNDICGEYYYKQKYKNENNS
jgi:hypothetical protein